MHVVGHSYGALTALFLAAAHPKLVRTLVVAGAPAMSLLAHMKGADAARGGQRSTTSTVGDSPMNAGIRAEATRQFELVTPEDSRAVPEESAGVDLPS